MSWDILRPLLFGVALLIAGVHALCTPYPRNLFRLRGQIDNDVPLRIRVRLPKVFGGLFLSGAAFIVFDVVSSAMRRTGSEAGPMMATLP